MVVSVVRPMLATSASEIPCGDEWTYEVKWDGYRTLALKDGSRVKLLSRNLKDATAQYVPIARAVAQVRAEAALLDGEIVALDAHGRPSFQALHHRSAHAIVLYAFDLLHLNGRDLTRLTLEERRSALATIITGTEILRSEPLPGTAAQIEDAVRRLELEGVIAKRRLSRYGKRSRAWIKVKFNRRQEFVIGGVKPNPANFESLLVGYYERGKLHFAGKVRAGLTPHTRAQIFRMIEADQVVRCPFVNLPLVAMSHWGEGITAEEMPKLRWVKPRVVIEVSFVEWTRDSLLRHSEFIGHRDDKDARDVRRR
jgi:bifunctional non-homologous end joining protein LigD